MKTFAEPAPFLRDLLRARSPSGFEFEAQAVFDRYLEPVAEEYRRDALGNRIATLHPTGTPVVLLAGHIDELGLMVTHIDAKGFLYFSAIGGHDVSIISGRRVLIRTAKGVVKGVTGKRALHLMDESDRKKVAEIHEIWIDIGAASRKEAESLVSIGDVGTYDHEFEPLRGKLGVARAFDDKLGAYIVGETILRLARQRKKLTSKVVAAATVQEEIGLRGAGPAAYGINPDIAIAVDVGHATDHPNCDHRKVGDVKLGGGPVFTCGANIHPRIFQQLVETAKSLKMPFQVKGSPGATGTDAWAMQTVRGGIATGLVSIPLRYMHTPCEVVDLEDVERCVKLLVTLCQRITGADLVRG